MASSEQSTLTPSDSTSQTSLSEAIQAQTQSHVHVRESVYNIDEETRMGPEMSCDEMTAPLTTSTVKADRGSKMETESAPTEEDPPAPEAPAGSSFSALSFIAAQYAESDNSSPRSITSPASMEDSAAAPSQSEPGAVHTAEGLNSVPRQAATHSSDAASAVGQAAAGSSGLFATAPVQAERAMAVEGSAAPSTTPSNTTGGVTPPTDNTAECHVAETSDRHGSVALTKPDDHTGGRVPVKPHERDSSLGSNKEADTVAVQKGESKAELTEDLGNAEKNTNAKEPEKKMDSTLVSANRVDKLKDTKDDMEPSSEPAGLTNKTGNVTQPSDEQSNVAVPDAKGEGIKECDTKPDTSTGPSSTSVRATETGDHHQRVHTAEEPKETGDQEEQSMDNERDAYRPFSTPQRSTWGLGGQSGQLLDTVKPSHDDKEGSVGHTELDKGGRQAGNFPVGADNGDSISQPEPMEVEDSKDAANVMDMACLKDTADTTQSVNVMDMACLKDTTDTMHSVTDMSEDSKPMFNVDSLLSCGPEESEDGSTAVKHRSPVIPFGENANSSMPLTGEKSGLLGLGENSNISFLDESSQSNSMVDKPSRPKRARRSSITDIQDSKLETENGLQPFPAQRVFEYQWPQDGGEWYLLQEQVSEYLAVLSFKRKYPDLTRRTVEKLEKEFLRERGVVTETQSDLGLTAIRSEEVYDLMMKDYPDKYHEYATVLHEREKQKISDKHKEYEVAQPKLEKSKMADYIKKAAKSAAEYNRHLLRERREERVAYFDLQTFMIHYPERRYKKLPAECTKPSAYPVALIPGQYQDHYCSYTSDELRYFPLNTALYDPPKKMQNTLAKPAGSSESSSDDGSEDKSGSSSDSSGSGSSDSDTPANATTTTTTTAANGTTPLPPNAPTTAVTTVTTTEGTQTPSKKGGKKGNKAVTKTPSKAVSKTPGKGVSKGKRKMEASGEVRGAETPAVAVQCTSTSTFTSTSTSTSTPPSPAPGGKEKGEEDEEDKDKCRICKNAVLFLKYKRVETKMIRCSECGKIAHPSCLDLTEKMVQVVTTYPWQCMECKTCVECMDPYDEDKMLFCDRCDRGYHTFCVGLRCLPTGRWECRSCKGATETIKSRRGRPIKPT